MAIGLIIGIWLAWAEVTLIDMWRYPVWSGRQLLLSGLQAISALSIGLLQALAIVVPVWLLLRRKGDREPKHSSSSRGRSDDCDR